MEHDKSMEIQLRCPVVLEENITVDFNKFRQLLVSKFLIRKF